MNARLERGRTASNVAVRLVWQVAHDLPVGTKSARDLLLKDPAGLGEADRESLHQFFRDRIEQAKADDTAASWEQQLAQVFDYRGQVFALLSALDLDLMLTSDHEWCTYAELSGVAIHQLITGDDGDDAVTTARFVWDGRDLLPDS